MEVCTSQIGEWNMNDGLISRKKAYEVLTDYYHQRTEIQHIALREALDRVPSADIDLSDYSDRLWRKAYEQGKADAQSEPLSDAYMKAVWTWLLDYQIKAAEMKGRYTPYEVLSWVANDWRKEHERSDQQTGSN